MKRIFFTSLSILSLPLMAQDPLLIWDYGYQSYSRGFSVYSAPDEFVYVAGEINDTVYVDTETGTDTLYSGLSPHAFVQKMSPHGQVIWAKAISSVNSRARGVAADNDGNVYVVGRYSGVCDFDPGDSQYMLTSGSAGDIFVLKLDGDGNFIWVRTMEGTAGTSISEAVAVAIDQHGNIVLTGNFASTVDFDPLPFSEMLRTSAGSQDFFIQKLNPSGVLLYVHTFGSSGYDRASTITTDSNSNIYIAGTFINTIDFNPGAGTAEYTVPMGSSDVYILKFDVDGIFQWVIFNKADLIYCEDIAVDGADNLYTFGRFENSVDLDPSSDSNVFVSNGDQDLYIQKISPGGELIWARTMGGVDMEHSRAIGVDTKANIYLCGLFFDLTELDPSGGIQNHLSTGNSDIFVEKLDSSGNFLWSFAIGSTAYDGVFDIAINANESIYITGDYDETCDFDPTSGISNLSTVSQSMFVTKYKEGYLNLAEEVPNDLFKIYPNPTSGAMTLSFFTDDDLEIGFSVTDLQGRTVKNFGFDFYNAGNQNVTLDVAELRTGIYFVEVSFNDRSYFHKIIKE